MLIPSYSIAETVFSNSRSIIYRAMKTEDGQPALIKLACQGSSSDELNENTRLEYHILQQLGGEGALAPRALLECDSGPAIILNDFAGEPLDQYLADAPFDLDFFFCVALQLVDILGEIHRHDIVHRDINTQIILVEETTHRVKLADFSFAAQLSRQHQPVLNPQMLEGTLAYMSPEQTGRMNRVIDYRTDFYSLGVTFYRMLTGTLPFTAQDAMGLVHCHIAQSPEPPHAHNPQVPTTISQIVLKLLAKTAEERYQSAYGIKTDLLECAQQWRTARRIEDFTLGRRDIPSRFLISQKLYGREAELAVLEAAFGRASAGTKELILVTGQSGIGKSSLVNEICKTVMQGCRNAGYFITGRCDQYNNSPYGVLVLAFRQLVRQLLTESSESIMRWRQDLSAALGTNAQIIVELIPEIQLIIGPQPPVAAMAPKETRNRFNTIIRAFIELFAKQEHPFTIFLDDLQWADSATLRLLRNLMASDDLRYFLLICTYRGEEIEPNTPLAVMIEKICRTAAPVSRIGLPPLNLLHVQKLLTHTLHCTEEAALPLARLVHAKTHGVPFFIRQLLQAIYAARLIEFDAVTGRWKWDIAQIQMMPITDNVVELMAENIRQLEPDAQELLKFAATLGSSFDFDSLALVSGMQRQMLARNLRLLQQDGLIVRTGEDRNAGPQYESAVRARMHDSGNSIYEFQHPRIQQAAYLLIPEAERAVMHLHVGRSMLHAMEAAKLEERLFEIVNHLNTAIDLIDACAERIELARFNLRAGKKAAASIAYDTAEAYVAEGIRCVASCDTNWEQHYQLIFELHLHYAQILAATGKLSLARQVFLHLAERGRNIGDKASVFEQYSIALQNSGDAAQALKMAKRGLALFHIDFPEEPTLAADETERICCELTRPETIARFAGLPVAASKDALMIGRLYDRCIIGTYFTEPKNLGLVISRNVSHVLERGIAPEAAVTLAWFAMFLGMSGKKTQAFEYGQLALEIIQKFDDPYCQGKTELLAHAQTLCWKHPFKQNAADLEHAFLLCHSAGDLQYASYALISTYIASLARGHNYHEILLNCQRWHDYCQKYVPLELDQAKIRLQAHQRLMGIELVPIDAEQLLAEYEAEKNSTDVSESLVELARVSTLFGDYAAAYAYCRRAEPLLAMGAAGNLLLLIMFYQAYAISAGRLYRKENDPAAKTALAGVVELYLQHLKEISDISPDNFRSYYKIAEAEWAAARGNVDTAAGCYLQAIRHAREHGYVLLEAWGNELLGWLYRENGMRVAQAHFDEARQLYLDCAANGKANTLPQRRSDASKGEDREAVGIHTQQLDLATIMKVSQAISSEIVLEKLIERMMLIVVENACAQQGTLLLNKDGALLVQATIHGGAVEVRHDTAMGADHEINRAVIDYVTRTCEPVVLDDAAADGPFMHDSWVIRHQPKSILCIPLVNQGKLSGIIYLENNLVTGAFTPDRIAMLELIASQAAISLENALLYANLQREQAAIRELNETLEQRVAERTAEARHAHKRLIDMTEALPLVVFQLREGANGERSYSFIGGNVREVLGVSAGDIFADMKARLHSTLPEDKAMVEAVVQETLSQKRVADFSHRVIVDGSIRWIHAYSRPQFVNGEWVWNGFWMDETDARRQREELRLAKEQAEDAVRTKSLFLANMSHEIRTPMNAIIGLSHLALKTGLNARQHEYIAKIHHAGTSLLRVVNDILDVSKIEAGKLHLDNVVFQLEQALDNVATVVGQKAAEKGLELIFDIQPDFAYSLVGDTLRLEQILINLIGNAVKFTEAGEVVVRVERLENTATHVKLAFSVRDTGIGITTEQQQRLFQVFTQADDSTTRKYGGTGLGLTICKRLVELMDGEIGVTSEVGKGSTFHFTVCFGLGGSVAPPALPDHLKGMHVLIVDDNLTARRVLAGYCENLRLTVREATGSVQVATMVRQAAIAGQGFGLVLIDSMHSAEIVRAIRADTAVTPKPMIVLTGAVSGKDSVRQEVEDIAVDGFLAKPVIASALANTLLAVYGGTSRTLRSDKEEDQRRFDGLHILLVEDNAINQQIAVELLTGAGITVEVAENGRVAVEKIQAGGRYDIVLMDLQMPEMDGYAATAAIRSNPSCATLPILAMTAHAMAEERALCLKVGMNDHIAKPINPTTLFDTLARWDHRQETDAPAAVSLPEDWIDAKSALRRVGGNSSFYKKLLIKFVAQHAQDAVCIQALLTAGDRQEAKQRTHAIRGAAANLGAFRLAEHAREIEQAIGSGQENDAMLRQLIAALDGTVAAIEQITQNP